MKKTAVALFLAILVFTLSSVTAFATETTAPEAEPATVEVTTDEVTTEVETPTDVTEPTSADMVQVTDLTNADNTTEQSIPVADVVITAPDDDNRSTDTDDGGTTLINAEPDSDIPKTGDSRILVPALVTIILASGAVVVLLVTHKKKVTE